MVAFTWVKFERICNGTTQPHQLVKEKMQSRLKRHYCWDPMWRFTDVIANLVRKNVFETAAPGIHSGGRRQGFGRLRAPRGEALTMFMRNLLD